MKPILNPQTMLLIIGINQPISAEEIKAYLKLNFEEIKDIPAEEVIHKFCMKQERTGRIIRVNRKPDLFSLTSKGNNFLTKKHRHVRDKMRVYLLKQARNDRLKRSHEGIAKGLGGDAPSVYARPTVKGYAANKFGHVVPSGQTYWPRLSKKLFQETCQSQPSCDTSYLPLLSFSSPSELAVAASLKIESLVLDFTSLGLMLGISPRLIVQIYRKPERHYRSFPLKKKGGGKRIIESPRNFLKIIQQFLCDYYLQSLPVHDSVQAFRSGHSIITNASKHSKKNFVGNIDIENFFGSISRRAVHEMLVKHGHKEESAEMISGLCTKDKVLPQGACTSPTLSNIYLYDFDEMVSNLCEQKKLAYSRYADDITISGSDRETIISIIEDAKLILKDKYRLSLNDKKTRIASKYSQQRVTGVVVNEGIKPPRKLRRQIRAAIHNAKFASDLSYKKFNQLKGYVSYLESYDELKNSSELKKYKLFLRTLKKTHKRA